MLNFFQSSLFNNDIILEFLGSKPYKITIEPISTSWLSPTKYHYSVQFQGDEVSNVTGVMPTGSESWIEGLLNGAYHMGWSDALVQIEPGVDSMIEENENEIDELKKTVKELRNYVMWMYGDRDIKNHPQIEVLKKAYNLTGEDFPNEHPMVNNT